MKKGSKDLEQSSEDLTLLQLRPDLFAPGQRLFGTDVLRAPNHVTPQMGLHWIAVSSVCSLSPEFASEFSRVCVALGADLTDKASVPEVKKSGVHMSVTLESKLIKISPLCSAILNRNTQAQLLFADVMAESSAAADPDAPGVQLQWRGETHHLSAWAFCAHLHEKLPLEPLVRAFRVDPESSEHANRMTQAVEHLLLTITSPGETERLFNKTSSTIKGYLLAGAVPDPQKALALGIDPAAVLSLLCEDRSVQALQSLKNLIEAKYPVDPLPKTGRGPLHLAAASDNGAALMVLLNAGANPRVQDGRGLTLEEALHQDDRQEMIHMLRSWTAKKFALDAMGLFDHFLIGTASRAGNRLKALGSMFRAR